MWIPSKQPPCWPVCSGGVPLCRMAGSPRRFRGWAEAERGTPPCASFIAKRHRPHWPWHFPAPCGAIRIAPRQRCGPRWPAGSVAGCSRRCAIAGLSHTRSWRRAGRRGGRARSSPISPLHPSARTRPVAPCWRSSNDSPANRSSDAELAQAVSYLAGQAEVGRQSGSALAGEILEAWLTGKGLSDLENPGAAFRAVSAADVQRVAERYLRESLRAEGVVRGSGVNSPVSG